MHRCFVIVGLVAAGCGGEYAPVGAQRPASNVVPVAGTLTYQGKPLEYYLVSFIPESGGHVAIGTTDSSGKFTLGTNKQGDGASVGTYKVSVTFAGPPADDDKSAQEPPPEDESKLPKPKFQLPSQYGSHETSNIKVDVPSGGLSDYKLELK